MISRPDSPLGSNFLRGAAVLFLVVSVGILFPVAMVPGSGQEKINLIWVAYFISLFLVLLAALMYWWSFERTPDLLELPWHAQLFGICVAGWVALITFGVIQTQVEVILRKR